MKTVKEMSQLSGVSVRTLHYYDEIDLLKPSQVAENGYRYYDHQAIERLQEILLFRELEFPLKTIKKIVDSPSYDRKVALTKQIALLEAKKAHLEGVLAHARRLQEGGDTMTFTAYDKSQLQALETEAKERWGDTRAYQIFEAKTDKEAFAQVTDEMLTIMAEFGSLKDLDVADNKVQAQVKVLQDYISDHFYPCSPEILAGLGKMYAADNRFSQTIDQAGGAGTADFVSCAIEQYCL
ncbi:MerR family transcriptional regulator [Streptococcus dentasini]